MIKNSRPAARPLILVVFFLVNVLCAFAQDKTVPSVSDSSPGRSSPSYLRIPFEKYKLKNGLTVILSEDHRMPLVAVDIWYHVGPANERQDRTGFAHLFEHMMFQGSKNIAANQHFKLLEGAGGSNINATTNLDYTNYFEQVPSNQLELALWLESDRMGFLLDAIDERNLRNQKDVVRNERRQSRENVPYGLVIEKLYQELFPKTHPYFPLVIGSHADIEAAQLSDVREFFKQYYTPNNATLTIVGDIDKVKTKALIEKYFGPIPEGLPAPKIEVVTPSITSERRAIVTDQVELPRLYIAWLTPKIFKPGDADADLTARILGSRKSSRLYQRLVNEKQIAQDVTVFNSSAALASVFVIQITARPGVKLEELEKAVDDELDALRKNGPTRSELEKSRNLEESVKLINLENFGLIGLAEALNSYDTSIGNPGFLARDLARYDAVTESSVQDFLNKWLTKNSRVVLYAVPGKKQINDVPKTPITEQQPSTTSSPTIVGQEWRAHPPEPTKSSKFILPTPQRFTLANGLTVLLVRQHTIPVIRVELTVLRGMEENVTVKAGSVAFTTDMLIEGTRKRSGMQIAEEADQIGVSLYPSSSRDASSVQLAMLRKNMDAGFDLLSDVVLNPSFNQDDLERVRRLRLTRLLQQRDSPNAIAGITFNHLIFGADHPYGVNNLGTEESISSITRDDMLRFWSRDYVPGNAALIVAGDITESELRKLTEKYFGRWRGEKIQGSTMETAPSEKRRVVIVDAPGASQTVLLVGHLGIDCSSPDYVPLKVMNLIFGGMFSSRLNLNLRETHGYTYGATSNFSDLRRLGLFYISATIRSEATADAVSDIFRELDRMRTTQVTDEELERGKEAFSRSVIAGFAGTPQIMGQLHDLFVCDRPMDFSQRLPDRIAAVTAADLQRVARKYLHPDSAVVVAAGDRKLIESKLKDLNIGPVEVLGLDGRRVE